MLAGQPFSGQSVLNPPGKGGRLLRPLQMGTRTKAGPCGHCTVLPSNPVLQTGQEPHILNIQQKESKKKARERHGSFTLASLLCFLILIFLARKALERGSEASVSLAHQGNFDIGKYHKGLLSQPTL